MRDLDVDADSFGRWICAHELTHVFQFQGVPWLREHMSGLLRRTSRRSRCGSRSGSAGGLPSLPDPAQLVETFREGGLAALVQNPEQRALMDEVQAAMSVVEGYSEHVMDAIAAEVIPGHEELRAAMDRRRRSRSAPQRIIERLLGFDVKLRQYEQGKRWADAVGRRPASRGSTACGRPRRRCRARRTAAPSGSGSSAPPPVPVSAAAPCCLRARNDCNV